MPTESYNIVEKFEALQLMLEENTTLTAQLRNQPHDQARVEASIQTLESMHSVVLNIYDILVDLNNAIAK
jgi:hypothetical protein